MLFKQIQVGGYDHNFSYIFGDDQTKQVMLLDPIDLDFLLPVIEKEDLKVIMLAVTHGHFDHAGQLADFYQKINPKPMLVMHSTLLEKWGIEGAEHLRVDEAQVIFVGGLKVQIIPTPGHEPGSICFLAGGKLMTGDTLFINGCGRADLPGSDVGQLYHSLYQVISALPDDTEIYPGHDYGAKPWDTLGNQKRKNPYLNCKNQEEFKVLRMGK